MTGASGGPWLHLDFTGDPESIGAPVVGAADDADPAIVSAALADIVGEGEDVRATVGMLGGLAGLERMVVWWRARALADSTGAPVVVPCAGGGEDAELSRLRLLSAPGELAGLIDAVAPRVDRHRQMPDVFGGRAGRARALERLWGRCSGFDRSVFGGGAVLHVPADGPPTAAADVAVFLGVAVVRGADGPIHPAEPARLSADGADGDGTLRFTWRVPLPGRLLELAGGECGAASRGRSLVAWAGPWRRRMTLPAVLGSCAQESVRVVARGAATGAAAGGSGSGSRDSGAGSGGDILVGFRSVAGLLPGGQ